MGMMTDNNVDITTTSTAVSEGVDCNHDSSNSSRSSISYTTNISMVTTTPCCRRKKRDRSINDHSMIVTNHCHQSDDDHAYGNIISNRSYPVKNSKNNIGSSSLSLSTSYSIMPSLYFWKKIICIILCTCLYYYSLYSHHDNRSITSSTSTTTTNNNILFASATNHMISNLPKTFQQQIEQIQQQLQQNKQNDKQQITATTTITDSTGSNTVFQQLWKTMQEQFTSLSEISTHSNNNDEGGNNILKNILNNHQNLFSKNHHHQSASLNHKLNQQHDQATTAAAAGPGEVTYNRRNALYHNSIHYHYNNLRINNKKYVDDDSIQSAYSIYSTHHSSNNMIHNGKRRVGSKVNDRIVKKNHKKNKKKNHHLESRSSLLHVSLPPFPNSYKKTNKQLIKDMFQHSYDSYMYNGYPYGEVKPISCTPHIFDLIKINTLTLIDSLDSLLIITNNITEFARSVERLRYQHEHIHSLFHLNENVSVFETNIRVVGGLLSAHLLAIAYEFHIDYNNNIELNNHNNKKNNLILLNDIFDNDGNVKWGYEDYHNNNDNGMSGKYDDDEMSCTEEDEDDESYTEEFDVEGGSIKIVKQQHNNYNYNKCQKRIQNYYHDISNQCPAYDTKTNNTSSSMKHQVSNSERQTLQDDSGTTNNDNNKKYWIYDGFLLELAIDIGNRLLPAFLSSKTGIPYGTVNLLYGVPKDETTVASTAGGGTLSIEFELLSRLSNNPIYGQVASLATKAIWSRHSNNPLHLFGKHIDIQSGHWVETLSGIGSNSDSFIEYLAKHSMLFPEDDLDIDSAFWIMLQNSYQGIHDHSRTGEWYVDTDMSTGSHNGNSRRVFESLAAFYPGLQVLLGELTPASRTLNSMFMVRELLGFLPERFNFGIWNLDGLQGGASIHPLRPELLESCYFMHRSTRNIQRQQRRGNANLEDNTDVSSGWQWAADFALHKLNQTTYAPCGYAGVQNMSPRTTGMIGTGSSVLSSSNFIDEMPSFFLSETLKYLYLTFDDDDESFIHSDVDHEWIFTTEAHPFHHIPKVSSSSTKLKRKHRRQQKIDKQQSKKPIAEQKEQTSHPFHDEIEALERILMTAIISENNVDVSKKYRRNNSAKPSIQFETRWTDSTSQELLKNKINQSLEYINSNRRKKSKKRSSINLNDTESLSSSSDRILLTNQKKRGYKDSFHRSLMLAPYVGTHNIRDAFYETESKTNTAHLSYENLSLGNDLRSSCPNLYSTEYMWIQALNGGAIDYSDMYISVTVDDITDHAESFTILGAAEALGLLGTGLYYDEIDDMDGLSCDIMESTSSDSPMEEDTAVATLKSTESNGDTDDDPGNMVTRDSMKVASDVGNFEISTFHDGSGFVLKNIDHDEKLTVNFMRDEINTNFNFAMIHSELRLPNVDVEAEDDDKASNVGNNDLHRNIVVTDFDNNSFSCSFEIIEKRKAFNDETISEDVVTVATYPCAPALYGPSHISRLASTSEGISLEANPIRPSKHNPMGCRSSSVYDPVIQDIDDDLTDTNQKSKNDNPFETVNELENEPSCPTADFKNDHRSCFDNEGCIAFVHRGACTFYEKTLNSLEEMNAQGVVVINDVDHEIFLMANAGEDEEKRSQYEDKSLPLTVLVTRSDGRKIMDTLQDRMQQQANESDNVSNITSRIVLKRKVNKIDTNTGQVINDAGDIENARTLWPVVRAGKHAIQILAANGWGVEAFQPHHQSKEPNTNPLEWQLQLLRHKPITP